MTWLAGWVCGYDKWLYWVIMIISILVNCVVTIGRDNDYIDLVTAARVCLGGTIPWECPRTDRFPQRSVTSFNLLQPPIALANLHRRLNRRFGGALANPPHHPITIDLEETRTALGLAEARMAWIVVAGKNVWG